MNLQFDINKSIPYSSTSQRIRVMSEDWVSHNIICPICGEVHLNQFKNNSPVADFYCHQCREQFELKSKESKSGKISGKINDGAYSTMIERITSITNPNFFFLSYNNLTVNNLILIPKHFFVPDIIEKRKPLSSNARRAGWVGCNINIEAIPNSGKIYIIKHGLQVAQEEIIDKYNKTKLIETNDLKSRGWLMDTLLCIDKIPTDEFTTKDIYSFENVLQRKYPNNQFVKDKIRQQLQFLRNKGFIKFVSRGNYMKIK